MNDLKDLFFEQLGKWLGPFPQPEASAPPPHRDCPARALLEGAVARLFRFARSGKAAALPDLWHRQAEQCYRQLKTMTDHQLTECLTRLTDQLQGQYSLLSRRRQAEQQYQEGLAGKINDATGILGLLDVMLTCADRQDLRKLESLRPHFISAVADLRPAEDREPPGETRSTDLSADELARRTDSLTRQYTALLERPVNLSIYARWIPVLEQIAREAAVAEPSPWSAATRRAMRDLLTPLPADTAAELTEEYPGVFQTH